MTVSRTVLVACCLSLACGGEYTDDQCIDIRSQIVAALQENVDKGVLVPAAVSCGPEGVANRLDSFATGVKPEDVQYLQEAFRHACAEFLDNCT
ncbi:MAG TPA: hypothetical protein VJU61_09010 [Polyangiaceae bacterium]|nr:hypothetical protein [Polyangiaceae bacterium]